MSDSVISNVIHHGPSGKAVTLESGPEHFREVRIANVKAVKD